jgi:Bifunctional DNA primase/polymerase, N-terminal/Primase C terminal 1 (PriCT-1)
VGLFKQIAEPLVGRGVPVIPLRPKTKIAFLQQWETLATTDPTKIEQWDQDYADANAACVAFARPDGVWFFEIDKPGFANEIELATGQKLPSTFMVRSSPGRGHFYFKQTAASIAMGNVQGKDENGKEAWSARVDNRYVVAPGSYHPTSGKRYETLRDVPIVEAPSWLIQWCISKSKSEQLSHETGYRELDDQSLIAEGGRNNALTSILGKARQILKMDREQLFAYGLSINEKRCRPPLSETEVRTIANSISGYEIKESGSLVFDQHIPAQDIPQPVAIKPVPYPVFPRWVIDGTSIGEGLVKPVCKINSRFPEFMFMPAMVLVLNYLALKVQIEDKQIIPSLYMISIGRKGRVIKSSSVQDAIEYLQICGVVDHGGAGVKNANGKSLVWTVGSPEGLGLEMSRTNNKCAVLFYDELSTLTNKASIEGSTLQSSLLSLYESGKFSNTVKSRKESYNFDPKTYCASLIACTTDKNFHAQWTKMSGGSSGLDERFFFLYQPEILPDLKPYKMVNTVEGAVQTRKLIEKAVQQQKYRISDDTMLEMSINKIGNRVENRVEKMALFFAIDLGKDEIDEGCIERALAIANYEIAVKKYLAAFESTTKEGALQGEIIQLLQRNGGQVGTRELERALHPERHGTFLWSRVYGGLLNAGWIAETGNGTKGQPKQIVLMKLPEEDE